MILLLAVRSFLDRPWRSLFLLLGYSTGVGVMIVLLSIGEALIAQARDERLVGGGEVTVLPEGMDVEVMKTGGLGGLFFSIDHARFVYRQLLASPRLADDVAAVAPQIEGKLLYLTAADGVERPVRAAGEIPSRTAAVGAAASLAAGSWTDDDGDRRWTDPTPFELRHEIDRFHLPPPEVAGDESWAEWHYFNVVSADRQRWAYIALIVSGAVPNGRWDGQVSVALHEQGSRARRFAATVPPAGVRFSTESADVAMGASSVIVLPDGRYAVRARAFEERHRTPVEVELVVTPAPHAYLPAAPLAGEGLAAGYVVPALRAEATGRICVSGVCQRLEAVQAYHDHNWGVWRGVTWDWGAARAGEYTVLYGRVYPPDSVAVERPLILYMVDSLGFLAAFRPKDISYDDGRVVFVDGQAVRVSSRAVMIGSRGDDTVRMELEVEDAAATDVRRVFLARGDAGAARTLARPYFVQMKGVARLSGQLGGRALRGEGTGFFETYR
jgi:hypothetical protein